jgi:hypothetical protein
MVSYAGSSRSRPQPELMVSVTLLTSKRTENHSPNDGFQSTADVADRPALGDEIS